MRLSSMWKKASSQTHKRQRTKPPRFRPWLERLEDRLAPATVNWINPAGGDWNLASNWDTGMVPGTTSDSPDVVINQPGVTVYRNDGASYSINSLSSQANLSLSHGALSIAGTSVIDGALSLSAGATLAGAGDTAIRGLFTWAGSTVSGGGTVTAAGGMATGWGHNHLVGGRLINQGTMAWQTGGTDLYLYNGARIDNEGTWDYQTDGGAFWNGGTMSLFVNTGTLKKTGGTGLSWVRMTFDNTATVAVTSGMLELGSLWSPTASRSTTALQAAGAGLALEGPFHAESNIVAGALHMTYAGGMRVDGSVSADVVLVQSSAAVTFNGSYSATTSTTVSGAQATWLGPIGSVGKLTVQNSSVATFDPAVSQDVTVGNLALINGSKLRGSVDFFVNGTLDWVNNTLEGVGGGGSLQLPNSYIFYGTYTVRDFSLINAGDAVWSAGSVNFYGDSSFTNAAGASLEIQVDGHFGSADGHCMSFYNDGLLRKSAGSGVTTLHAILYNSGTVQVEQGIIRLTCGYVPQNFDPPPSGVEPPPGQPQPPIVIPGPVPIPIVPLPVYASYTQTVTSVLIAQLVGHTPPGRYGIPGVDYGQVSVAGDVALDGSFEVRLLNDYTPAPGKEFLIIDNLGPNPIDGIFVGLPEGATVWTGVHGFTVSYQGGNGNDFVLTATNAETVTFVTASPSPSVWGDTVTLTATVEPATAGAGTPSGTVTFYDGSISLGSITIVSGVAELVTSALSAGSHTITAVYSGDGRFTASDGAVAHEVLPGVLTVTPNDASKVYGADNPAFSATISGFVNGDTLDVVGGTPSLSTSADEASEVGTYAIVATAGSLSAANYTFAFVDGTLSITPAELLVIVNDAAKVYGQDYSALLTGTIIGIQNGDPIAAAYISDGASPSAAVGIYAIDAVLSDWGTGKLARDYNVTIVPATLTVDKAGTTTQVTSSANPSNYGQAVTFTATVTANAPGGGTPSGTVTFYDGAAVLATVALSNGMATWTTTAFGLAVGNHDITAQYHGDDSFLVSTAAVLAQQVLSAQQQVALLIDDIDDLVNDGLLDSGNGNALTTKLDGALASLDEGNVAAGVNQLQAFINQVNALVNAGKLTAAQAQTLIDAATAAIVSAQGP